MKMLVGEGLLGSEGAYWRSQRQLVQRDFIPQRIAPFVSIMASETARTAETWQKANGAIDIATAMTRLTLRIVVKALFSEDLTTEQSTPLCDAVTQACSVVGKISRAVFGMPMQVSPEGNARLTAARGVIDAVSYDMIARRRSMTPSQRPPDLLTMLIEADTEHGPMDDRQLRDEIVTMLAAGHETTAVGLAWAWKAIAEHPEVEAKLHQEVDQVLSGRLPDLAALPRLTWSRAVFQEAMRLYPPVWLIARVAAKDDVVDGHAIPRGASVLVSTWLTHRHRDFWPDAERFAPARFLEGSAQPLHRHAYFPFGGGRHTCLGTHFALLEGTLILAQLARQFRLRPLPGQQVRPDLSITLRQAPGLCAHAEVRGLHHDSQPRSGLD